MPWCYGTITGTTDELSLAYCTCNPADPLVAKWELGQKYLVLLDLLRNARRMRQAERRQLRRLLELTAWTDFSQPSILREQCQEIRNLVLSMISDTSVERLRQRAEYESGR